MGGRKRLVVAVVARVLLDLVSVVIEALLIDKTIINK